MYSYYNIKGLNLYLSILGLLWVWWSVVDYTKFLRVKFGISLQKTKEMLNLCVY